MKIPVLAQSDFYKVNHYKMYPENTSMIYSNLTPRGSRMPGVNHVVVTGIQYFILEYLIEQWNQDFFAPEARKAFFPEAVAVKKRNVINRYKYILDNTLGKDVVTYKHIEDLWNLGYMPLHIKALPEGTLCPVGVPCMTIRNTVGHAYWLVNFLETIISCSVWQMITSATIAFEYKKLLTKYAVETAGDASFVLFQGHDFSMRGMSSLESACLSGAGHLLSFLGTDTIPAILFLEQFYNADLSQELVGTSVPATEHSVMCMGEKDSEIETFRRLLNLYPTGILSVVSDTWDLWKVLTEYLPQLKEEILARDGKLVIRPDSGDPVDIICGTLKPENDNYSMRGDDLPETMGVIELLWDIFGGTIVKGNDGKQYKQLDPHIGAIYGDSITLDRAKQICERLKAKGFASTNIVFGIGSYTYQYNTRDTFKFAVKATYGEIKHGQFGEQLESREIFKDPITDDGSKKSAKGLLQVYKDEKTGELALKQQCTWEEESQGLLETVFLDGKLIKQQSLKEIRERLNNYL